jgi:hypothetical protein
MDCGGRFPACAMDFDHRDPTTKVAKVMNHRNRVAPVLREIAKCDLVCANCHRIRTFREKHHLGARVIEDKPQMELLH